MELYCRFGQNLRTLSLQDFPELIDAGCPCVGVGNSGSRPDLLRAVFRDCTVDKLDEFRDVAADMNDITESLDILRKVCGDDGTTCREILIDLQRIYTSGEGVLPEGNKRAVEILQVSRKFIDSFRTRH